MAGMHDVYILQGNDGNYHVRPAVAPVTHGSGIHFRNLTGCPVALWFPAGVVASKGLYHPPTTPPPPRASALQFTDGVVLPVNAKGGPPIGIAHGFSGEIAYVVDVNPGPADVLAVGESDPKIIVDP